jgi:diguanylate cyclase (GGDEF)-like protein
MDQENLEVSLKEIRHLLSHLHGEVTALEEAYGQVLLVLRKFEGVAEIDDLTGLLRRKAFFRKWEALLDECRRLNESCGVLMIDIDHFKRINDTHGHATGDEVLKRVSGLLKQFESPNCVVARLGGEEFAVVVRGTDAETLGIAELIRRGAERLHGPVCGPDAGSSAKVEWKCTLSAGMASARKEGYDASRLLQAADAALYQAKEKGRNQVRAA